MGTAFRILLGCLICASIVSPHLAHAQVANMPAAVQERLRQVGPGWGKDISGNIARTFEVYAPLLAAAPKDGVQITRDVAYGPDPRHRLDVHAPAERKKEGGKGSAMILYFHGGAYVRGERNVHPEVYGNIATYFARQGLIGINGTYRLAPQAKWPAAAQDLGRAVAWAHENAVRLGGDPARIFLMGHSAGATHAATYGFDREAQPPHGHGLAGLILMSGRYLFDPSPDDPNLRNFEAYFGTDRKRYPVMSPINHINAGKGLPTFVIVSEYDNPDLDTQGAMLFSALCQRDRACPRFTRMAHHNHLSMTYQFNTRDDAIGREILEFISLGR
jgi:acetyl esterase